jgi:DNA gyrase subunit A
MTSCSPRPQHRRGEVGVLTSAGRVHRLGVLDLPAVPGTAQAPHLQGGVPISEFLALDPASECCV